MEINSLDDIDSSVLVDANVLLNAIFLPAGVCANAIQKLRAANKVLAVEEITWRECERKIRQLCPIPAATDALVAAFQNDCACFGLLHLPPSPGAALIDDHDAHVIAAAMERVFPVLTADNGLRVELVRRAMSDGLLP